MEESLRKGAETELTIEKLAFGGHGISKMDNFTIFVDRAIPGQVVRAKIYQKKQNYAKARVLSLIAQSPDAIQPECPHFDISNCGGCLFQNLPYSKQLEFKSDQVAETLAHIGGLKLNTIALPIPSEDIFFYRNKMEFSFDERWYADLSQKPAEPERDFALGLHISKFYNKVFDVTDCKLFSPESNHILNTIRRFSQESGLNSYNSRLNSGFWRFVTMRQAKNTNGLMVSIITADARQQSDMIEPLAKQLQKNHPDITTMIHGINRRSAQIATSDQQHILSGSGYIVEVLGNYRFRISPNSFFQTNTRQAEKLYQRIVELAEFEPNDIVYDLYTGTGTIAIFISNHVRKVVGFELVEEAIVDARMNCELNAVENCEFKAGDIRHELKKAIADTAKSEMPSVVIADPPRIGMHPAVVREVLRLAPKRIIYVSCNPATLARDLQAFTEQDYILDFVQPIDMFPHTAHIEVISRLIRKI
ncbi:23S rRNA (uracil(1939)-C(5))-methyltransferase RlmD [candidate division KSB1 bacterium]|nr:23S rRNA (uracil(1939)-C(5))-methyltransferase RlmD [candidate division KSB1 bacterium]